MAWSNHSKGREMKDGREGKERAEGMCLCERDEVEGGKGGRREGKIDNMPGMEGTTKVGGRVRRNERFRKNQEEKKSCLTTFLPSFLYEASVSHYLDMKL